VPIDRRKTFKSYYKLLRDLNSDISEKELEVFFRCGSMIKLRIEIREVKRERPSLKIAPPQFAQSPGQERP
jgi:hypothetical protein